MPGKKHQLASKVQERWAFAAEKRGELTAGTAERWAHKAKGKNLPVRANPVQSPVLCGSNPELERTFYKKSK